MSQQEENYQNTKTTNQDPNPEMTDADCWTIINEACREPQSVDEIWSPEVIEAYANLTREVDRAKAKSMLKAAIRQFQTVVDTKEFVKGLDRRAAQCIRAKRKLHSNELQFVGMGKPKLWCGEYTAIEAGIYLMDEYGNETCVCNHPIYIAREIIPVDDAGRICVELKYRVNGGDWQSVIVPKRMIRDRKQIIELIENGIDASSENAGGLIQYFRTLENWSYGEHTIPESKGCGRFGWVNEGKEFMPYADGITFTGAREYKSIYDAIATKGTLEEWREAIRPFYKPDANQIPRMALAASVAAPIVGYMDDLPFFVHLFGASGHGKTVSLMLAASVWGNPKAEGGGLVQSFSSTAVGMERRAAVMCNMPMILDEVGVKGARDKEVSEIVYQLTEGVGKTRGSLEGLRQTGKWSTVFISSGEQPLTSDTSQAGVINRIISVDCNGQSIFGDDGARKLVEKIRNSYGHAGKMIVQKIMECGRDEIHERQRNMQTLLNAIMPEGMNKQILAASWLMAADQMLQEVVFNEILDDDADWLTRCIATKEDVDMLKRVLDWIEGWRGGNGRHFFDSANDAANGNSGVNADVWGFKRKTGVYAYNPTILKAEMEKSGFDYKAFISAAKAAGIIMLDSKGKTTVPCWVGGTRRFLIITTPEEEAEYAEPKPPVILNMMPRS